METCAYTYLKDGTACENVREPNSDYCWDHLFLDRKWNEMVELHSNYLGD